MAIDFDDMQFQAGRTLLEMPLHFDECSVGQQHWIIGAFRGVTEEAAGRMNAGKVALRMLAWKQAEMLRLSSMGGAVLPEFAAINGVIYEAVEAEGCIGCAFTGVSMNDACAKAPPCGVVHRSDGRNIVWVRRGT